MYIQYTHHRLTLCVSVLFADNAKCQFAVAWYGFPVAVVVAISLSPTFSVVIAETLLVLFFIFVSLCNGWNIAEDEVQ